ncbi:MAG: NAD(P)/FAD-dependent oxidoreductase [Saprospiraceae bacterium]
MSNQQQQSIIETKVCIIGAGPGGAAAALKLDRLGIPCVLLDKAVFPRDKVCGDALSGKVVYGLNRIDKQIALDLFEKTDIRVGCWGIKFVFPNTKELDITVPGIEDKDVKTAKPEAFISKRIEFDNFLVEEVRKSKLIDFREGVDVQKFERIDNQWIIKNRKGETIAKTNLLLDASGALSRFSRDIAGIKKEDKHFAGGIRAYYKNVKGFTDYNFIEIYFEKELTPGYLWIFPLPNGYANVGLGMRTDHISKGKVNLKKALDDILKNNPRFKHRFDEAELDGKVVGFPLPLGSKKRKISGDGYLLIGDAASLIDPLTGEGIGNAIVSGKIAGEIVQEAIENQAFDATVLKKYDKAIYKELWRELKISHQLQRMMQYPWIVNILSSIALRSKEFTSVMTAMFTDVDLRKKLRDPRFYFRLLFSK